MWKKMVHTLLIVVVTVFWIGGVAAGGDLDDNISMDDSIDSYDTMGDPDKNINFIKMKAKSQAKMQERLVEKGVISGGEGGTLQGSGAMNSVVVGPGSRVRDVYIIDESRGDKTQVVE